MTPLSASLDVVGFHQTDTGGVGLACHNRCVCSRGERGKERRFPIVRGRQTSRLDLGLVRIAPVVIRSNHTPVAVMTIKPPISTLSPSSTSPRVLMFPSLELADNPDHTLHQANPRPSVLASC
jgi:hypothetical protein